MAAEKKRRKPEMGESEAAKAPAAQGGKRISKAQLVSKVLENMEKKLASNELKPTVGDFIRLVQLEKELTEEQPREIKVSWVEPEEKSEKDKGDAVAK